MIAFAIPSDGPVTITTTLSPLPVITAPVEIDGTTETGTPGVPGITIDGSTIERQRPRARAGVGRLDDSRTRDPALPRSIEGAGPSAGILVQSDGNTIAQNYVGTTSRRSRRVTRNDVRGSSSPGSGNTIGGVGAGNLVSGNGSYGILIDGSAGAHDNVDRREPRRHGPDRQSLAVERDRDRDDQRRAAHGDRRQRPQPRATSSSARETGIDIQGIAGVPDNSEIRFNNVGVGKDGTTTLGTLVRLVGRRQQRRRRDHRRQRRRQRRERPRARELERPHGRPELHRRRSRRAATRGTSNEGIDVQQTGARQAAAERARQRQHGSLQRAPGDHHRRGRPHDCQRQR